MTPTQARGLEWDDEHRLLVYLPDDGDVIGFWLLERLPAVRP